MSRFRDEIMPIAAKQLLMSGVTTVRDLGAPLEDSLVVRSRIEKGEIPGPRLFVSGPFIQHRPYFDYEKPVRWGVDGADDARAKVQKLVDAGVDFIKLIDQDQMTEDELAAVVATAHKGGKPVVAHAHREAEIRLGLKYNVDCFEHTGLATEPGLPRGHPGGPAAAQQHPLLVPHHRGFFLAEYTASTFPDRLDDPRWQADIPQGHRGQHPGLAPEHHQPRLLHPDLPPPAHVGQQVPAAARDRGHDAHREPTAASPGDFHTDSTWRELDTWVRLGATPMQAIGAATRWPARFLKKEKDLGTLAPGRLADVIAVQGATCSPTSALLQRVDVVVKGGGRPGEVSAGPGLAVSLWPTLRPAVFLPAIMATSTFRPSGDTAQRELSYRKRLIEIANMINSAPEHPGHPGRHQGQDPRPRGRRARHDLRPRHQEPGAVLAVQGRPGGQGDPRPQDLRLDRGLHRALAQDRQHQERLRPRRAGPPPPEPASSTRAGTRPRASAPARCWPARSCSRSTCWACCSSSTSAAGGGLHAQGRGGGRGAGQDPRHRLLQPAPRRPHQQALQVRRARGQGPGLREGHRERGHQRARQPDRRGQGPDRGLQGPQGGDRPGARRSSTTARSGSPRAARCPTTSRPASPPSS